MKTRQNPLLPVALCFSLICRICATHKPGAKQVSVTDGFGMSLSKETHDMTLSIYLDVWDMTGVSLNLGKNRPAPPFAHLWNGLQTSD